MPAYNTYKSTMKKNTFLILSLLLLYLYPLSASVEIRSNKLTTGDGLANNSTRYTGQTHYIFTIFSFVISFTILLVINILSFANVDYFPYLYKIY